MERGYNGSFQYRSAKGWFGQKAEPARCVA